MKNIIETTIIFYSPRKYIHSNNNTIHTVTISNLLFSSYIMTMISNNNDETTVGKCLY